MHALQTIGNQVEVLVREAGKYSFFKQFSRSPEIFQQWLRRIGEIDRMSPAIVIADASFQQSVDAQPIDQATSRCFRHFQQIGDHALGGTRMMRDSDNHGPLRPGNVEPGDLPVKAIAHEARHYGQPHGDVVPLGIVDCCYRSSPPVVRAERQLPASPVQTPQVEIIHVLERLARLPTG